MWLVCSLFVCEGEGLRVFVHACVSVCCVCVVSVCCVCVTHLYRCKTSFTCYIYIYIYAGDHRGPGGVGDQRRHLPGTRANVPAGLW